MEKMSNQDLINDFWDKTIEDNLKNGCSRIEPEKELLLRLNKRDELEREVERLKEFIKAEREGK